MRLAPASSSAPGERNLRWAVGLTAVVLIVVVALLVGRVTGEQHQSPGQATPAIGAPGATSITSPTGSTGVSPGGSTASSSSPTTSSTATAPAAPAGPPVLSALSPSTGQGGQSVTVTGSNFLSPTGQIIAEVGGQVASVACPDPSTCTVTIPAQSGTGAAVPVVISTDSGTSNALLFTYG